MRGVVEVRLFGCAFDDSKNVPVGLDAALFAELDVFPVIAVRIHFDAKRDANDEIGQVLVVNAEHPVAEQVEQGKADQRVVHQQGANTFIEHFALRLRELSHRDDPLKLDAKGFYTLPDCEHRVPTIRFAYRKEVCHGENACSDSAQGDGKRDSVNLQGFPNA